LVNLFRLLQLPQAWRSIQIETLRARLFKIGARIRQTARCTGSSGHGLALASPVRQTRARPQHKLAASCVANPFVSHVKEEACSKNCLPPSSCSTSPSLRPCNALRDDSNAKKSKIPTAER
jgi:hypothetical protein